MIKKIAFVALVTMASCGAYAAATTVCDDMLSSGNGTQITNAMIGFVATSFTPKCSANTIVRVDGDTARIAVGATSTKGKNGFMGTSVGGGVKVNAACAASPCVESDATAALTAAMAVGS